MKLGNIFQFTVVSSILICTSALRAAEPAADPQSIKELILPGEAFLVADHPAFVFWPPEGKRSEPQPWIMYAPTLPGFPDSHEKWMHERFLETGVAVAGVDAGETYGSPQGQELCTALYRELTENRGFAKQPCLLGRSRGGLWVGRWAIANPDKVAGIAGIYPVFDLRTYPGVDKAAPSYGLAADELTANLAKYNPIQRTAALAEAKIPVFIIHGKIDEVVPLKENSAALQDQYKAAGAGDAIELIVVDDQGHNYWEGFFRCQELIDFVIKRAKVGASSP